MALGIAAWAREQRRQEATNASRDQYAFRARHGRSRPIPILFDLSWYAVLPPAKPNPVCVPAHPRWPRTAALRNLLFRKKIQGYSCHQLELP